VPRLHCRRLRLRRGSRSQVTTGERLICIHTPSCTPSLVRVEKTGVNSGNDRAVRSFRPRPEYARADTLRSPPRVHTRRTFVYRTGNREMRNAPVVSSFFFSICLSLSLSFRPSAGHDPRGAILAIFYLVCKNVNRCFSAINRCSCKYCSFVK